MAAPAVAGYSWTPATLPSGTTPVQLVALGARFVLGCDDPAGIWYSDTGDSWTRATSQFDAAGFEIQRVVASDTVVAVHGVSSSGSVLRMSYSTDGVNWANNDAYASDYQPFATASTLFSQRDGTLYTSSDGATWTARTGFPSLATHALNGIYEYKGVFLAVVHSYSLSADRLYSSTDLNTWTLRATVEDAYLCGFAVGPSQALFVIGGDPDDPLSYGVLTSADGVSWTQTAVDWTGLPPVLAGVFYSAAESAYVAYGGDNYATPKNVGPVVAASVDGVTWQLVASSGSEQAMFEHATLLGNGGHYIVGRKITQNDPDRIHGLFNTLTGWHYVEDILGASPSDYWNISLATNSAGVTLLLAYSGTVGAKTGWLLVEEPTPFGEAESSAEASSTTEGVVMTGVSAESTADAQSSFVAELGGRAATLGYTATAASVLAAQPIIVVVELGSGDLTSDALATLVRTATHNGAASAGATATGSPVLVATSYGLISGNSTLRRDGSPSEVWVITEGTGAISRYRDYDFTSFGRLDGRHYGISEDGVYSLDEDTSGELAWSVDLGEQWFGDTLLSRLSHAYMGVSSSGTVYVRVEIGEQEYLYQARAMDPVRQTQRFDFGLGLRAACYELVAVGEGQAEVSSVEFVAVPLTRRI